MIYAVCLSHLTGDLSHSEVIYCLSGVITAPGVWRCSASSAMRGLAVQIPRCKPLQVSELVIRSDFYRSEMKLFRDASCRQSFWNEFVPAFSSQDGVLTVFYSKLDLLCGQIKGAGLHLTESG